MCGFCKLENNKYWKGVHVSSEPIELEESKGKFLSLAIVKYDGNEHFYLNPRLEDDTNVMYDELTEINVCMMCGKKL